MPAAVADPLSIDRRIDAPPRLSSVGVMVYAKDPISRAGVSGQLVGDPGIDLLEPGQGRTADVAVVVAEMVDSEVLRVVRTIRKASATQVVVVAGLLDTPSMLAAIDSGAAGFLLRPLATREQLIGVITGARQTVAVPPPPRGGHPSGGDEVGQDLTDREREVLRLLADGCDTAEIARRLAYSEPTIKNVVQRLFERLQARNRPHAVAVALRAGII
jgi:DNA-binding NarL/FixJ family response regulator